LRTIAKHRKILTLFVLSAVGSLSGRLITTFRPLFLTDLRALALDESVASVIPMASSISSIIALSLIVPRLKPEHIGKALLVSYVSGSIGLVTLAMAPRDSMFLAVLSTVFDSARFVATFSILPVLIFNTVDEVSPLAQAKIMSLTMTFSALVSWPMPAFGGLLYTVNPTFPFLLAAISLLVGTSLLLSKTWLSRQSSQIGSVSIE